MRPMDILINALKVSKSGHYTDVCRLLLSHPHPIRGSVVEQYCLSCNALLLLFFDVRFFTVAIIYVSVGSIYNYKWKDERGFHALPNYVFWAALGGYVKVKVTHTFPTFSQGRIQLFLETSAYKTIKRISNTVIFLNKYFLFYRIF
jgi:hypothetical protein